MTTWRIANSSPTTGSPTNRWRIANNSPTTSSPTVNTSPTKPDRYVRNSNSVTSANTSRSESFYNLFEQRVINGRLVTIRP